MNQGQMRITPETALEHIDNVCAKFEGTRTDHAILQASIQLLANVVKEHKQWRDERDAEASKAASAEAAKGLPVDDANGKGKPKAARA